MKRIYIFVSFALLMASGLLSCGESARERSQREEIDSLQNVNQQARMDYDDLQQYLGIIAEGLDSIAMGEDELLTDNTPGENNSINRQRLKQNLDRARDVLLRQRSKIADLEEKLANSTGDGRKLRTIITALRQQIDEKDRELAQLREDLEDNRKSVEELTGRVARMAQVQEEQAEQLNEQMATIEGQAEQLSTGYLKIGTKQELKSLGLLSSGFLKKSKVDYGQIDEGLFERINVKTTTTIPLPGKAKIMTAVPEGSYEVVKLSNGNRELHVLNAETFWSVSKFLIIQID